MLFCDQGNLQKFLRKYLSNNPSLSLFYIDQILKNVCTTNINLVITLL